jgi:signal transduction histidine kinase
VALIILCSQRIRAVFGRHLVSVDVIVAAALGAGGLVALSRLSNGHGGSAPLAIVSCAACFGAVALRRIVPKAAMALVVTAVVLYQSVTQDPQGSFVSAAVVLVSYIFGRSMLRSGRALPGALILGYAFAVLEVVPSFWQQFQPGSAVGIWLTVVVVPAGVGALVERRHEITRELAAAAERLRDEQQVRIERAAAEERNRVARDLHDVVAHHLSVMVIQAGAARTVADQPQAVATALRTVSDSGREALTDLRRITGVLRRSDHQWSGQSPRLEQLDALLERTRSAGVSGRLRVVGDLRLVPADIDLAAYRVIQEALTNVVKHAETTSASVEVRIHSDALVVAVTNDGPERVGPGLRLPTSGQGLVGMQERVGLYGGELKTGHRPGGGYQVRATIPLSPLRQTRPTLAITAEAPQRRPRLGVIRQHVDLVLAGIWFVVLEAEAVTSAGRHGSLALNMVVVGAMAALGIWRRRWPLLFVVAVGAMALLLGGGLDTLRSATVTGTYVLVVPVYTVAAWESRGRAVAGLVVWQAGMVVAGVTSHAPPSALAGAAVMATIVWVVGRVLRSYRRLQRDLTAAISRLESESAEGSQLAIAEQRAMIARDLDLLVASDVTAMIVQAEAARTERDSEPIADAVGSIEDTGRHALARMRDILGVLRVSGAGTRTGTGTGAGGRQGQHCAVDMDRSLRRFVMLEQEAQ